MSSNNTLVYPVEQSGLRILVVIKSDFIMYNAFFIKFDEQTTLYGNWIDSVNRDNLGKKLFKRFADHQSGALGDKDYDNKYFFPVSHLSGACTKGRCMKI